MTEEKSTTDTTQDTFDGPRNIVAVVTTLCIAQVAAFLLIALLIHFDKMYLSVFIPVCILYHAMITFLLYSLRKEFRYCDSNQPLNRINLANIITLFRISAMPSVLALIIASKDYNVKYVLLGYVFLVFVSDFFDGYVSRKLKETTCIGKILDSTSDYLVLFTIGVAYIYYGMISTLLFFTLLLRLFSQGFIQIAGLVKTREFNTKPTIFGKIAVASTMIYFFAVLIKFFYPIPIQIYNLLELLLVGILIVSIAEKLIVLYKFIASADKDHHGGDNNDKISP